jgi:hypothetical protein
MRSTVTEESGALQVSIPMKRRWLVIPFLLCWLTLWTYGGFETGSKLAKHFEFFDFVWMGGWAFGEFFAIAWCLRTLAGRDEITVHGDALTIRKQIFGVGLTKIYSIAEVRDLRFQPEMSAARRHRDSRIAFDYGAKTITFGDAIDEAEATQLITLIKTRSRFPQSLSSERSGIKFWQSD